jgi:hypothetical protein
MEKRELVLVVRDGVGYFAMTAGVNGHTEKSLTEAFMERRVLRHTRAVPVALFADARQAALFCVAGNSDSRGES